MRLVEIKKLNDFIAAAGKDINLGSLSDMFEKIDKESPISLQREAIASDRDYVKELTSLLNVIITIVHNPHIANKGEDVVVRIEQANALGTDEFRQVLLDSKLWKRHGAKMIPEEVHYRRYTDELRIYENRFIVYLIDLIERDLSAYSAFYLSMLPTLELDGKYLSAGEVGDMIVALDALKRKIQYLKGTYFYKVVSEGGILSGTIRPTNILTKDRLYKYCFKFYRTFVHNGNAEVLSKNLRAYYMICILKELKQRGFKTDGRRKKRDTSLVLLKNGFNIVLEMLKDGTLTLSVSFKKLPCAKHLLLFDKNIESEKSSYNFSYFTTAELITVWYTAELDFGGRRRFAPEDALISRWLDERLTVSRLDRRVYGKYCPVCRASGIEKSDGICRCLVCTSEYSFVGIDGKRVWFRKIRK